MQAPSSKTTRVIVDCQLLQTSDRTRGMGLYLKSLLAAIPHVGTNTTLEWVCVLNSRLPELTTDDKVILDALNATFIEADLLHEGNVALFAGAVQKNRAMIDRVVTPYLSDKSTKTIFFIPALFAREIYPVFPTMGTANLLLFHDFIPFLFHRQYFQDHEGVARKDYAQRFREFYKTDLFVTNSQTTADDLTIYFGIDPSRIVPTLGAAADRSGLHPEAPAIASELADGYVFLPSGDDMRKNNELAVSVFASLGTNLKLVLTSNFSPGSKRRLPELCPNVVFAGSVSDSEFLWLMDNAKAVFFPALYEGLGMPILEAVERGVKVACSNIPVFTEISPSAFYYFDPTSSGDMASVLREVLDAPSNDKQWQKKKRQYPDILKKFSWSNSAKLFLQAIARCEPAGPRKKLAIFCPSPSTYSSVGKYAFEAHGELSRLFDIDYYTESGQTAFQPVRPNILEYAANYYPAGDFDPANSSQYDHVLYHIGNSEFHVTTILESLRTPAAAIIHDTRLNGVFDYMELYGFIPMERRQFEALLDARMNCQKSSCLTSIATNQKLLFYHSRYARQALDEVASGTATRLEHVIHPVGVPTVTPARRGTVTISFAGIISEDKGISLVGDVSRLKDVRVHVFGFGVLGDSPLLESLSNVSIMRDLTDKEFQDATRASDILVNYRPNYHGETSRSTLEAMRFGAVVIVKNIGWYSELPDDVVVKVDSEAEVLPAIRRLVEHPLERSKIGAAARAYLAEHYNFRDYAAAISAALEGVSL